VAKPPMAAPSQAVPSGGAPPPPPPPPRDLANYEQKAGPGGMSRLYTPMHGSPPPIRMLSTLGKGREASSYGSAEEKLFA
jgi:hypothetical protein